MSRFDPNKPATRFERKIITKLVWRITPHGPWDNVWREDVQGEEKFGGRLITFKFRPIRPNSFGKDDDRDDPSSLYGVDWRAHFHMPMTWPSHVTLHGEDNFIPMRRGIFRFGNQESYERDLMYIAMAL